MFFSGGEDGQVCHQPLCKIGGFLNSGLFSSDSDHCVCGTHPDSICTLLMGSKVKKNQCEHEAPAVCRVLGSWLAIHVVVCLSPADWMDTCRASPDIASRGLGPAWSLPRDSALSYVKQGIVLHFSYEEFRPPWDCPYPVSAWILQLLAKHTPQPSLLQNLLFQRLFFYLFQVQIVCLITIGWIFVSSKFIC